MLVAMLFRRMGGLTRPIGTTELLGHPISKVVSKNGPVDNLRPQNAILQICPAFSRRILWTVFGTIGYGYFVLWSKWDTAERFVLLIIFFTIA